MSQTIRAIYGARKAAGLDDDAARDVYQGATGKRSLSEMTPREQVLALQAINRLPRTSAPASKIAGPYGRKLQALWISGWHLGVVTNRRDEALLAFVAGRTEIEALRFLRDARDARKAVEALKSWLAREGSVDWTSHRDPAQAVIAAQGRRLGLDNCDPDDRSALAQAWHAFRGGELEAGREHEVMQLFGEEIRRRKCA